MISLDLRSELVALQLRISFNFFDSLKSSEEYGGGGRVWFLGMLHQMKRSRERSKSVPT